MSASAISDVTMEERSKRAKAVAIYCNHSRELVFNYLHQVHLKDATQKKDEGEGEKEKQNRRQIPTAVYHRGSDLKRLQQVTDMRKIPPKTAPDYDPKCHSSRQNEQKN